MMTRGLRIGAASVVHWLLGGIWYAAFSAVFARFVGAEMLRELETRSEALAFGCALASSLAVVLSLDWLLRGRQERTTRNAWSTVAVVWIGAIVTAQLQTVLFEGRHVGLFLLGIGYQLVGVIVAAMILLSHRRHPAHGESQGLSSVL